MIGATARDHNQDVLRTVLIVDDQAGFRELARQLLEHADFDVVGEAADGVSAAAACRLLSPDIVLLDIQLPDVDGFSVAEALVDLVDPPVVVLISSRDRTSYRRQLSTTRATAFISKERLSAQTLRQALG